MKSCYDGDYKLACHLVENGADVNVIDKYLNTALIDAIYQDHYNICHMLIDAGADVKFVGQHKMTALHYACQANKVDLIEKLISKGANCNAVDVCNKTPLISLLSNLALYSTTIDPSTKITLFDTSRNILKLLKEAGADLSIRDDTNKTYYDYATQIGLHNISNVLKSIQPGSI
jgi:hypothetical protein